MSWQVKEQQSLLDFLVGSAPDSSKTTLRSWITEGRILVDGVLVKDPRMEVSPGALVDLAKKRQYLRNGIEILHQDRDLLVIYKPSGMLSVPSELEPLDNAYENLKQQFRTRTLHIVHRLDREVSGVMVFAFSQEALDGLKKQFEEHSILREYIAVVAGRVRKEEGTWESYLLEDGNYFVRSVSSPEEGKLATTHYKLLKQKKKTASLKVTLETGRKNQIRVHASEAGHPLLGDKKYGSEREFNGRVALQAWLLGFHHPITEKKLLITRELDPEFGEFVNEEA